MEEDLNVSSAVLELMEAAYGSSFNLIKGDLSETVAFSILLDYFDASITFWLPKEFPEKPLTFSIDGSVTNATINNLKQKLLSMQDSASEVSPFDLSQKANEYLLDLKEQEEIQKEKSTVIKPPVQLKIARFLIYFHHIMSSIKRKELIENAADLRLGGFSKIGYPGIVIIEGPDDNVLEYVRRIQRLRWKQMVVRGEEIEELSTTDITSFDRFRKLPLEFWETEDMSEVGSYCKEVGLHSLFMTALKKYESFSGSQDHENDSDEES